MVVRECAHLHEYYGELSVDVVAPRYYYGKSVKRERYSYEIYLSKGKDMSNHFFQHVSDTFSACGEDNFDLLCAVPSSNIGETSPTLLGIAKMMSSVHGIPNENIIVRTKKNGEKMSHLGGYDDRNHAVCDCLALLRPLRPNEKRVLLLDDTKTSGNTILECTKTLKEAGAEFTLCICLGINSTVARE